MATSKRELEIIKKLFSTQGDDDKKSLLKSIKGIGESRRDSPFSREIKECPHYKSTYFKKHGIAQ